MKNKLLLLIVPVLFLFTSSHAQQDSIKLYTWVPTAIAGLNVSQVALSNWSQGGQNSLTWSLMLTGSLKYKTFEWTFNNNLKVAYGRTRLGGEDFRTNDNELYLESVLSRDIGWDIKPYLSNILRTSVGVGYSYDADPPVEIASFFDPAYLSQSLGFIYDKPEGFSTRLGFAVQETFASQHTQFSDDPDTPEIEEFKAETGVESVTDFEYTLAQNLLLKTNLRLFSTFENPDVWDVRWDNAIVAKVNDFLNASLTYLLVYQKDQSVKTQMKEGLQLGLVYTIL